MRELYIYSWNIYPVLKFLVDNHILFQVLNYQHMIRINATCTNEQVKEIQTLNPF